jgi:hypothetical protein
MKTTIMYMIEHIANVPYGHTKRSLEKKSCIETLNKMNMHQIQCHSFKIKKKETSHESFFR